MTKTNKNNKQIRAQVLKRRKRYMDYYYRNKKTINLMKKEYRKQPKNKRRAKERRVRKNFNTSLEVYEILTKKCFCCGYNPYNDKTQLLISLHHIDGNNKHNNITNWVGLCEMCHMYIHKNHLPLNYKTILELEY